MTNHAHAPLLECQIAVKGGLVTFGVDVQGADEGPDGILLRIGYGGTADDNLAFREACDFMRLMMPVIDRGRPGKTYFRHERANRRLIVSERPPASEQPVADAPVASSEGRTALASAIELQALARRLAESAEFSAADALTLALIAEHRGVGA